MPEELGTIVREANELLNPVEIVRQARTKCFTDDTQPKYMFDVASGDTQIGWYIGYHTGLYVEGQEKPDVMQLYKWRRTTFRGSMALLYTNPGSYAAWAKRHGVKYERS